MALKDIFTRLDVAEAQVRAPNSVHSAACQGNSIEVQERRVGLISLKRVTMHHFILKAAICVASMPATLLGSK